MSSMIIGLASGSIEKLVVISTLTGGAVALDMDVDIYLLLGAPTATGPSSRMRCSPAWPATPSPTR